MKDTAVLINPCLSLQVISFIFLCKITPAAHSHPLHEQDLVAYNKEKEITSYYCTIKNIFTCQQNCCFFHKRENLI